MRMILRVGLIFLGLWGIVFLLGHVLEVNPFWPAWVIPLMGAIGAELVFWTYRYEKSAVGRRRGKFLLGLRMAELVTLLWIFLQPVWSRFADREIAREVIVLVDESASMDLIDIGETKGWKARWG